MPETDSSDSNNILQACLILISDKNLEKVLLLIIEKWRLNDVGVMCSKAAPSLSVIFLRKFLKINSYTVFIRTVSVSLSGLS